MIVCMFLSVQCGVAIAHSDGLLPPLQSPAGKDAVSSWQVEYIACPCHGRSASASGGGHCASSCSDRRPFPRDDGDPVWSGVAQPASRRCPGTHDHGTRSSTDTRLLRRIRGTTSNMSLANWPDATESSLQDEPFGGLCFNGRAARRYSQGCEAVAGGVPCKSCVRGAFALCIVAIAPSARLSSSQGLGGRVRLRTLCGASGAAAARRAGSAGSTRKGLWPGVRRVAHGSGVAAGKSAPHLPAKATPNRTPSVVS